VRNSGAGDREANVKLFSAMLHQEAIVIAQLRVPQETTETTQVKALLDPLEVAGSVNTADAAHTQHATAEYITGRQADYVLTLKANQPNLLETVKTLMHPLPSCARHAEREHTRGKIVTRTIWTHPAEDLAFPGAAQVFRIRRETTDLAGRTLNIETVHGITSLTAQQAGPGQIGARVRGHWGIENKSHWVRDAVFGEDDQHAYLGSTAHTTAVLHNLAIGLFRLAGTTQIKRATEHIAADRTRILTLLAASRP
jgi:predicted transposase YbfD/YdcC